MSLRQAIKRVATVVVLAATLSAGACVYLSGCVATTVVVSEHSSSTQKAGVGELVELKAEGSEVVWFSEPPVGSVCYGAENENCVTAFKSEGRYLIYSASIDANTEVLIERHEIIVGKGETTSVPPTPDNPFVDLCKLAGPGKDKVSSSFRGVARSLREKLEAGVMVTPAQIVAATTESNKKAVAGSEAEWRPFFDELAKELESLSLRTVSEHIQAWEQIAVALEK